MVRLVGEPRLHVLAHLVLEEEVCRRRPLRRVGVLWLLVLDVGSSLSLFRLSVAQHRSLRYLLRYGVSSHGHVWVKRHMCKHLSKLVGNVRAIAHVL